MKSNHDKLLFISTGLAPFVYFRDGDLYRSYEVISIAAILFSFSLLNKVKFKTDFQLNIIILYGFLLVIQQFFIQDGDLIFGIQYLVVIIALFLPSFYFRSCRWHRDEFVNSAELLMKLISIIAILNIFGGKFFGIGETYENTLMGTGRYFGMLGDSFTPVILYPLIYFFLQRRFVWVLLLILCLIFTGGKTAAVMLLFIIPVSKITQKHVLFQFILYAFLMIFFAYFYPYILDYVSNYYNTQVNYSWHTRVISYELGFEKFISSPIFGVGINKSMISLSEDADNYARLNNIADYYLVTQIHNPYIRALAETGVVGLILLLIFSVKIISDAGLFVTIALNQFNRNNKFLGGAKLKSLILAGSWWSSAFVISYQTTGWFENGHPQLAWLLLIASISFSGSTIIQRYQFEIDS